MILASPAAALRKRVVHAGGSKMVIPRGLGQVTRDSFYEYAQNFTFVGNENQQATINIQTDADFLCVMTMFDTNVAAGVPGAAFGGSLVQLTDLASGRQLSNIPVAATSLFGTAQRPYVWPFTHWFRAGGGITISATGIAAATAQTVRYVFAGFKVPVGVLAMMAQAQEAGE